MVQLTVVLLLLQLRDRFLYIEKELARSKHKTNCCCNAGPYQTLHTMSRVSHINESGRKDSHLKCDIHVCRFLRRV